MAKFAIIVGNINYTSGQIRDLPPVEADIKKFSALAKSSDIKIVEELRDVGRTSLLTTLRRACKGAGPEDDLVIYYSGHGQAYRGRDYLVPADAEIDDFEVIHDILVPIDLSGAVQGSKASSITMIIDACREGIELSTKSMDFTQWSFQKLRSRTTRICLAFGCAHGEYSHTLDNELGSLFTHSLCEAVAERDYALGTIQEVMDITQSKIYQNVKKFGKLRRISNQTVYLDISRRAGGHSLPQLFPNGKRLLGTDSLVSTGWHPQCDFLWPSYTGVYEAWRSGQRGDGITIFHISGPIYSEHIEFRNKRIPTILVDELEVSDVIEASMPPSSETNFSLNEFAKKWERSEQKAIRYGSSHSTSEAGLLAGINVGMCPDSNIINLNIFNSNKTTTSDGIVLGALQRALQLSQNNERAIILLLVGHPGWKDSKIFRHVFERISSYKNIILVIPAGNDAKYGVALPQSTAQMLSVSGVTRSLDLDDYSEFVSHGNNEPDIYGIGGGLLPTSANPFDYSYERGSSYAAVYVAGIASLVWSANPHYDAESLRNHLLNHAKRIADTRAKSGVAVVK